MKTSTSGGSFVIHAAIYGFGTLLLQAASVVLLPLYTHYLSPSDFGVLEVLTRTGQVIGIFLMANGISTATFAFYCQAKTNEERQKTAATVTVLLALLLFGGSLAVVAFARPLAAFIGIDSPLLAALGVIVAFVDCGTMVPMCLAQARTESVCYVCASLAVFVFRVLLITVAVAYFGWGIWGILIASFITAGLSGGILNLREFWGRRFRPDLAIMRQIALFALPFLPGGLCLFVLNSGDRFFLVSCIGKEDLGVYSLGCKLAMAVGMFSFTPLFKVWSARMYEAFALPDAADVVGRAFTRMLAAYVTVGLGLCIFSEDIVQMLASKSYTGAAIVVGPLVLAGFFSSATVLMDGAFYVRRRTGVKPWIAFSATVVMCGLYAVLIPQFGSMGAAAAAVGGYGFLAAATWAVSQRVFHVRYEYGRLVSMLLVAIALALAAGRLSTGLWTIPAKLALIAAWPALLWITGFVTREETAMVNAAMRRLWQRVRKVCLPSAVAVDVAISNTERA